MTNDAAEPSDPLSGSQSSDPLAGSPEDLEAHVGKLAPETVRYIVIAPCDLYERELAAIARLLQRRDEVLQAERARLHEALTTAKDVLAVAKGDLA